MAITKLRSKAIKILETGDHNVLMKSFNEFDQVPENHILIKNQFSGVNFIDTYHRSGLYPVRLPFTLGVEGGGEIVDSNSRLLKTGQKVVYFGAYGSYAEHSLLPESEVIPLPSGLDLKIATGALLQGLTAEFLTNFIYPIKTNDKCLIHAGAGGVGLFLIQFAKLAGAEVFTTVSTEEKAMLAKSYGADHAIHYMDDNFAEEIINKTEGLGVNVVFDSVGKDTFEKSLDVLTKFGHMITFGNSSGAVPEIQPLALKDKGSIYLSRPSLFDYKDRPLEYRQGYERLFRLLESGDLKLHIDKTFPVAEASKAHQLLESRGSTGKLLLEV